MKPFRRAVSALALTLALASFAPVLPAPASAMSVQTETTSPSDHVPSVDSRLGVLAAVACGFGVRYFAVFAEAGIGGIALVVAVCLFAFVDALESR